MPLFLGVFVRFRLMLRSPSGALWLCYVLEAHRMPQSSVPGSVAAGIRVEFPGALHPVASVQNSQCLIVVERGALTESGNARNRPQRHLFGLCADGRQFRIRLAEENAGICIDVHYTYIRVLTPLRDSRMRLCIVPAGKSRPLSHSLTCLSQTPTLLAASFCASPSALRVCWNWTGNFTA